MMRQEEGIRSWFKGMYMGKGRKRGEKRLRAERQAYGDWQVF
jgi:hypothetical protein